MSEEPQEKDERDERSPSEKLEEPRSAASLTPGREKPESEVQNEKGMNTE